MRQVFHTQGFEYPQLPAALTTAINGKAEPDSHLPRFFSVSRSARRSLKIAEFEAQGREQQKVTAASSKKS